MNRQQFLVELNQYLTFFTPEEKAKIIAAYGARFDENGQDSEAALLAELGTPMMVAIDLKRRKEAGERIPAAGDGGGGTDDLAEGIAEAESEDALPQPDEAEQPETVPSETVVTAGESPSAGEEKPSFGADLVLSIIGSTLLSILIAAFFLVIAAAGAGFLVAMSYLFLTGLKTLLYPADALLLFSGGLVSLAVGIVVLWLAAWSAISLIAKLFRAACGKRIRTAGKECGV
ncbi:MAG: DUF1700 domain-containing protein [Oscillospiraceae bacterium]|jgi:uncharacterized membrane protein|nr:DUF1700 domain-containing protein [Oscillospiraceae bacterium]